jgi:hypothetical protein
MRSYTQIRAEYKRVIEKIKELEERAADKGWQGVLPEDHDLYFRLYEIKQTLEWVAPSLIKTQSRKRAERRIELMGYRHYVAGPLHALLYP